MHLISCKHQVSTTSVNTWLRGATGFSGIEFSGIEFNGFAVVQKSGFGDREVGDIETLVDCGREGSDDAQLVMIVMRNR